MATQLAHKAAETERAIASAGHDPKRQAALKAALNKDLQSIVAQEKVFFAKAEPYLAAQQRAKPTDPNLKKLIEWVHQEANSLLDALPSADRGQALSQGEAAVLKRLTTPNTKWTDKDFAAAVQIGTHAPQAAKQFTDILNQFNPAWGKQYNAAVGCAQKSDQAGLVANIPVAFAASSLGDPAAHENAPVLAVSSATKS